MDGFGQRTTEGILGGGGVAGRWVVQGDGRLDDGPLAGLETGMHAASGCAQEEALHFQDCQEITR